jgi:P2-related tail formation protein
MIEATPTGTSTSNFRAIFVAALEKYREKTKTDLLTHPLATQLQSCNSSSDILAVLHDTANEFDESRRHMQKLSIWLKPTIYVLFAFSATLGDGVGLVRFKWPTRLRSSSNYFRRYSHRQE